MKIEVGKRYIRRDGSVTPPLESHIYTPSWVKDPETRVSFDPTDKKFGWMTFPLSEAESPFDLIQEYEE